MRLIQKQTQMALIPQMALIGWAARTELICVLLFEDAWMPEVHRSRRLEIPRLAFGSLGMTTGLAFGSLGTTTGLAAARSE